MDLCPRRFLTCKIEVHRSVDRQRLTRAGPGTPMRHSLPARAKSTPGTILSSAKQSERPARSRSYWPASPLTSVSIAVLEPKTPTKHNQSINHEHPTDKARNRHDLLRPLPALRRLRRLGQRRSLRHHDRVHPRRLQRPHGDRGRAARQPLQHRLRPHEGLAQHSGDR
jgi:hypothetical protein